MKAEAELKRIDRAWKQEMREWMRNHFAQLTTIGRSEPTAAELKRPFSREERELRKSFRNSVARAEAFAGGRKLPRRPQIAPSSLERELQAASDRLLRRLRSLK